MRHAATAAKHNDNMFAFLYSTRPLYLSLGVIVLLLFEHAPRRRAFIYTFGAFLFFVFVVSFFFPLLSFSFCSLFFSCLFFLCLLIVNNNNNKYILYYFVCVCAYIRARARQRRVKIRHKNRAAFFAALFMLSKKST